MDLFCAVDVRDGGAVRLVEGDFSRQADYGDPVELARRYAAAGAPWIHVVDLDAARSGQPVNRDVVLAIAAAVDVPVQAGGGVRTVAAATTLLDGGVERVVVGTAAVREPHLVEELSERFPGRVAVGLDHRRGGAEVAVSGWEAGSGKSLDDVLEMFSALSLAAVVVTAIERDGTMSGPDAGGLSAVLARCPHDVVASGGVRHGADLAELAALAVDGRRLAGVIVGKALADGVLDVKEAIAACAPSG